LCWFNNKEFCVLHVQSNNYILPISTVIIQLHVSVLYVDHLQVEILCITRTVKHNYILPISAVRIQLHVSVLYVGHLQVEILCITRTVKQNYILPISAVRIQLHVSRPREGSLIDMMGYGQWRRGKYVLLSRIAKWSPRDGVSWFEHFIGTDKNVCFEGYDHLCFWCRNNDEVGNL